MNINHLIYSLTQVEDMDSLDLDTYIAGQIACDKVKEFIEVMSPRNIYEMEEMFEIAFNMIETAKVSLNEEMAKEILLCILKKLETMERELCPEFSDKEYNFASVSVRDSLINIAQSYIRFVESVYLAFNSYLKEMSQSYYTVKKEILRKSLNSMEDLCLI